MKHLKLLNILVVSSFTFVSMPAWSCISFPKNVQLRNSPFPFSEFDIFSESFTYKTSDGTTNKLTCGVDSDYSWSADSWTSSGDRSSYGYEDLRGATVYADDKEEGQRTKITFGDTSDMAFVSIKRDGGQASLQVVCTKEGDIRTLAVRVINSNGQSIGEISSSSDMSAPKTRSLSRPQVENGIIDFNSSNQVGGNFMSSGCGRQEEVERTAPGVSQ